MIPVFYQEAQSCPAAISFSPSAGKPALAVADWLINPDISPNIEVRWFEPASRDMLYAVHDRAYVDGVLDGLDPNGFGNRHTGIAKSLPYTTGSMVAAAHHVLTNGLWGPRLNAAISPTSGFHHAGYSHGGGYCTFNGLMAAAVEMHRLGLAKRVLILDFDNHYGDGTEDIIRTLGIDYVDNITSQKSYSNADELLHHARHAIMKHDTGYYDLLLFQAGADVWKHDPLGGMLSLQELEMRDKMVLDSCIMRSLPVVVNLAGGYSKDAEGTIEPVLKIHRQTVQEMVNRSVP